MNPGGEHKSPKGLRYLVQSHQTRSLDVLNAAHLAFFDHSKNPLNVRGTLNKTLLARANTQWLRALC